MQKITLAAALFVLAALMGCGPAQAPEEPTPTATTTPTQVQPPSQAPSPTAVASTTPEKPPVTESIPATTASPTTEPEDEAPAGVITPLTLDDPESVASELSDQELACLAQIDDTGELLRIFSDPSIATAEQQTKLVGCLNDQTVARIFLEGFVPDSGPLSLENIHLHPGGVQGDRPQGGHDRRTGRRPRNRHGREHDSVHSHPGLPEPGGTGSCRPQGGHEPGRARDGMVCVLEQLGGPGEMVAAMIAANEGHATTLSAAAMECGLDMGTAPAGPKATPMPTATTFATSGPAHNIHFRNSCDGHTGAAEPVPQETGPGGTGFGRARRRRNAFARRASSPALVQDAQMYAEQFGVDLQEAVTRLMLQEPAGKLGATLEEHEGDAFAGLWIQHKPEFGIVVAFTRDGQETVRQYIQDGPLEELVEVRHADATLRELMKAQAEANRIVSELGFQVASGIYVFENRVELYADNPAQLEEAIEENGLALPDHVLIIGH